MTTSSIVYDSTTYVLAVYKQTKDTLHWQEQHLYGSSRLGMLHPGVKRFPGDGLNDTIPYYIQHKEQPYGARRYEITNHLGNVTATLSDRKMPVEQGGDMIYKAVVHSAVDYYPYGSIMPGRSFNSPDYRYSFNGKEKDDEIKGSGNSINFGARIYDPRTGRWLSVDPLADHPNQVDKSPYAYAWNNPVKLTDPDGRCPDCPDEVYVPLADHVYSASKGDFTSNGWEVVDVTNNKSGLQGALYRGTADSGFEGEYIYSTAGTQDLGKDGVANVNQVFGASKQYSESVGIAEGLAEEYSGVSFTGHSLGGGLASANALATEGKAVTFNAAGLSGATKKNLNLSGKSADITAYIVSGEILDNVQRNVGLRAEGNHEIFLPGVGKNAGDRHRMSNVKAAFSIWQSIKSDPNTKTFNYNR